MSFENEGSRRLWPREGEDMSGWVKGLAEWTDDQSMTAFLSVAFTWRLSDAYERAIFWKMLGYHVRAGGPALFRDKMHEQLPDFVQIGGDIPDAVTRHNPDATFASRGCDVGCWFCIVPAMEGRTFTLIDNFTPRPVLCDSNLSGLPPEFQDHIVRRYEETETPLIDPCQGFEPRTFTDDVYRRFSRINRGPWRFAYDDMGDREHVRRVMKMLRDVSPRKKRVFVLIGNEEYDLCMQRIREVIEWGGEPHVQPYIKLNSLDKKPWARAALGWNPILMANVARWANRHVWKRVPFEKYDRAAGDRAARAAALYNERQGYFI